MCAARGRARMLGCQRVRTARRRSERGTLGARACAVTACRSARSRSSFSLVWSAGSGGRSRARQSNDGCTRPASGVHTNSRSPSSIAIFTPTASAGGGTAPWPYALGSALSTATTSTRRLSSLARRRRRWYSLPLVGADTHRRHCSPWTTCAL